MQKKIGNKGFNKTLEMTDRQLNKMTIIWREATECFGHLIVDRQTIAMEENKKLASLFKRSRLSPKDSDHWKLLLQQVVEVLYSSGHRDRQKNRNIQGEVSFLEDMHKALIADESIKTARKLAETLKLKYKQFGADQSLENKISKLRKIALLQLSNSPTDLELPISSSRLRKIVALVEGRLTKEK